MVLSRKATYSVALLSLLSVSAAGLWWCGREVPRPASSRPPLPSRESPLSLSSPERQAVLEGLKRNAGLSVSPECRSHWEAVAKVDWEPWANVFLSGKIEIPGLVNYQAFLGQLEAWSLSEHCQGMKADHPIRRAEIEFLKACKPLKGRLEADSNGVGKGGSSLSVQMCFRHFVEYQVIVMNRALGSPPLDQMRDLGLLRLRYLAEAAEGDSNPQALFQIVQRMVVVEPTSPRVLHIAVASVFSAWKNADGDDAGQDAVLARQYIDQLAGLAPDDPDLPAFRMEERRLAKDFEGLRRLSTLAEEKDPEVAVYYRAWAAYDEEKYQEAETILGDFLKTGPAHPNFFQAALEGVRTHRPGRTDFNEDFVALRRLGDRIGLDDDN